MFFEDALISVHFRVWEVLPTYACDKSFRLLSVVVGLRPSSKWRHESSSGGMSTFHFFSHAGEEPD